MGFRVLGREEVAAALDMRSCVDAVERAFAAFASGRAELPGVIHLEIPEARGEIHVKAGHLHGEPRYAVKVASGFYGLDPPAIDGLVLVFDARDGSLAALLADRGLLTDVRTGAAGGVAARHLAPERVDTVAVIGTGAQARYQLDGLAAVRPGFSLVRVWGRRPERAARCVEDLRARPGLPPGCRYEVAASVREAVEGADVVVTCTASREPLVRAEWVRPGALVTAVGADGPGKRELEPEVLARADLLVVDSLEQCRRLGELQHAPELAEAAVELGAICAGRRPGRSSAEQTIVCDLTGVGVQDVAAANLVLERAADAGRPVRR
ncbi:MAG: cyclodeaminase [Actinomycetota bacterium]|nr:MAG: cyclodeaminase [Actinomycetota bacterium]